MKTIAEKRRFIRQLVKAVERTVIDALPRVPKEWDGHELREIIADAFDNQRTLRRTDQRRRLSEYKNERLCRNLP